MMEKNKVLILDYGSQYTQLIARRVRECGVYSEILPCTADIEEIEACDPAAIILSGGPCSVADPGAPGLNPKILDMGLPVLGICYGMHLLAKTLGGQLESSSKREFGRAMLTRAGSSPLWAGLDEHDQMTVWMSHGDRVTRLPAGFEVIGSTADVPIAAMADQKRRTYGLQFHPEVSHTEAGLRILANFVLGVAELSPSWSMSSFIDKISAEVMYRVEQDAEVVCGLSGGIDSTVTAILLSRVLGDRLHCIFVDTGLLRFNEGAQIVAFLRANFNLNLTHVQAEDTFLGKLAGVEDPEEKRKIIGKLFVEIFEREAAKFENVQFLAQGTLYPDVIESVSFVGGPSAVIKSHHNVGGLPEAMRLKLIEPLRELFKDEVRKIAADLGLPDALVWRHPFPGPGLAIRVVGPVTKERLDILRQADQIVQDELTASGWYRKVWQGFAVLLPIRTVGVMGDDRTYENVIALRVVDSIDAMTADWTRLPSEILAQISSRIINEVKGVNRVVYDISSKPPSTIEWE